MPKTGWLLLALAAVTVFGLLPQPPGPALGASPASASGSTGAEHTAARGIVAVSAGGDHSCAVTSAGGVKCWGDNVSGALGDGSIGSFRATPVDVSGLSSGVAAASAGGLHTCALTTEGGVKCWGNNNFGQLGDGQACGTICSTPVDVAGLSSGVAAVSAGFDFTCGLTAAGGLMCWGRNDVGQLGSGTDSGPETCPGAGKCSSTPVDVVGLSSGVSAIAVGFEDACAITSVGGVKCWGDNRQGGLGVGSATGPQQCAGNFAIPCSTSPADVEGLSSDIVAMASGVGSCAVTNDGGLKCWGPNSEGELGDGTSTGPEVCSNGAPCSTRAIDVPGLASGVVSVSSGGLRACALMSSGGIKCWGDNHNGELGNGTSTGPDLCAGLACGTSPADVLGLTGPVKAVSVGQYNACAVTMMGAVECWGNNGFGELGNGVTTGPELCGSRHFSCSTKPIYVASLAVSGSGDANCDGETTSVDASIILQYSAGLVASLLCTGAADVNQDAQINSLDAALVLQYAAGLIPQLPVQTRAAGDTTWGS